MSDNAGHAFDALGTSVDGDTGVVDGSDGGTRPELPPAACSEMLIGEKPFGRVLTGSAYFSRPNRPGQQASLTAHIYFPTGRRPGGTVVLAMPGLYPKPSLYFGSTIGLDGASGVHKPELAVEDDRGNSFLGQLIGPVAWPTGIGKKNFATSDVLDIAEASITLCPAGPVPEATLIAHEPKFAPTLPLAFAPTAPFAENTFSNLRVTADGQEIPTRLDIETVWTGGKIVVVTPVSAFPPNAAISVVPGEATDVVGRPFRVDPVPQPLVTTASVVDFEFSTAPPPGAIAQSTSVATGFAQIAQVDGGVLSFGRQADRTAGSALVSLGDPGAATRIHLQLAVTCMSSVGSKTALSSQAALVGAGGEITPVPLACDTSGEVTIARPAMGPLWLSVVLAPTLDHPQSLPALSGNQLRIDQIRFD